MATVVKKPVTKKKTVTPVKATPRATATAQLSTVGPHEIVSGLGTASLPVLTTTPLVNDPLNPGSTTFPTATVADKPKTGFGKFIADNGGIAGIVGSLGSIVATAKHTNKSTKIDENYDTDADGNGSPDSDNFTVLGIPPFAFAALVLLLMVGLIVVLHKKKNG